MNPLRATAYSSEIFCWPTANSDGWNFCFEKVPPFETLLLVELENKSQYKAIFVNKDQPYWSITVGCVEIQISMEQVVKWKFLSDQK